MKNNTRDADIFIQRINEKILEMAVDYRNKMRNAAWEITRSALKLVNAKTRLFSTIDKN